MVWYQTEPIKINAPLALSRVLLFDLIYCISAICE